MYGDTLEWTTEDVLNDLPKKVKKELSKGYLSYKVTIKDILTDKLRHAVLYSPYGFEVVIGDIFIHVKDDEYVEVTGRGGLRVIKLYHPDDPDYFHSDNLYLVSTSRIRLFK